MAGSRLARHSAANTGAPYKLTYEPKVATKE